MKVTIDEVYKYITDRKPTNSTRFDALSSKTIKIIPQAVTMWVTHLLNVMLKHETFLTILKHQKITPIRKQTKNSN